MRSAPSQRYRWIRYKNNFASLLIVIIPEANLDYTIQRASYLRSGIKSLRLEHDGQLLGSITSSFGVACFPEHGQTLQAVIAASDAALYRAKASGRDRVISKEYNHKYSSIQLTIFNWQFSIFNPISCIDGYKNRFPTALK